MPSKIRIVWIRFQSGLNYFTPSTSRPKLPTINRAARQARSARTSPQSVLVFDEIKLDGSDSDDPDGTIEAYEWQLNHREDAAHNRTATGETPTVSGLESGFYDVILTVTDDDGAVDTDEMMFSAIGRKGDLNLDGDIDGLDLSEFADVFGSPF